MTTVYQALKRTSIIDESLMATMPENCCLYVHVALPFLSFSLFDRVRNKYICLCEYRLPEENQLEELNTILKQDEILHTVGYNKTVVSFQSDKSVLVPAAFYNEEDAWKLLSLTSPVSDTETLCADRLKYTDAVQVYAISSVLLNTVRSVFHTCKVVHSGTVLMESELLRNKNNTESSVTVNVRQGSYDIVVTTGNQLLYYNSFTYNSSEDFIYYLLYVLEQLKLNPEKTAVRFLGEMDKHMASFLITAKYIRNISFGSRPESFEYSYGFSQVSNHAHAILLNQYLCES